MSQHDDRLEADPAAVAVVFLQLLGDPGGFHVQRPGEGQRVEGLHLPRGHEDVVGDLVADEDLVIAVVDDAAGRVDAFVDHRVGDGFLAVAAVDDLDVEHLAEQDGGKHQQAYYELDVAVVLLLRLHGRQTFLSPVRRSAANIDRTVPTPSEQRKRTMLNHAGRTPAPSAQT